MAVGKEGSSDGVAKYLKIVNDLIEKIKEGFQKKFSKEEHKEEKKKEKVAQAMRLLSTLETISMAKTEDKAPMLKDIQKQQEDLESSLDQTDLQVKAKKSGTVHKKVKKILKKKK